MSRVVFIRAWPRDPSTGAPTLVRLAGGGSKKPYLIGADQYRAGIVKEPRFSASVGFDKTGWTGGALPTASVIGFSPADPALLTSLGALFWPGAAMEIDAGDEDGVLSRLLTGTVAEIKIANGSMELTVGDLAASLDKPAAPDYFAGTGGAEGATSVAGRHKRRSWGRVFNVEGRVLDPTNNIYEFGDPARPLQGCLALRDKGLAGSLDILAWQGSIDATLAALVASMPTQGGGVFAPSIACAKWWTVPAGPLTADLLGEVGSGYVETVAGIASRMLAAASGPALSDLAGASALRAAPAGLHIDAASETLAGALDRLMLGASLIWRLNPAGTIDVLPWAWDGAAETVRGVYMGRDTAFAPHAARRIGYHRNERQHSDAEIAATVVETTDPALGTNQLSNSHFRDGMSQWMLGYPGTAGNGTLTFTSGRLVLASPAPNANAVFGSICPKDGAALRLGHHLFRVTPGERIAIRIKGSVSRNNAYMYCRFRYLAISPGSELSGSTDGVAFPGVPNYLTSTDGDIASYSDVPSGAYWVDLEFYGTTSADTSAVSISVDALQFSYIDPTQVVPPIWSEGPTAAYTADNTAQNAALGVNVLVNSEFTIDSHGWLDLQWSGFSGVAASMWEFGRNWPSPYGGNPINLLAHRFLWDGLTWPSDPYFFGPCQVGYPGGDLAGLQRYGLKVKAGERVYASGLVAIHGGHEAHIRISFFDNSAAFQTEFDSAQSITDARHGGPNANPATEANLQFLDVVGVAPVDGYAAFGLWGRPDQSDPSHDSWLFLGHPLLAKIGASQTVYPPYTPGPSDRAADKTSENTALDTANVGGVPVATLITTINNIGSDSVLSRGEKPQAAKDWAALYSNWAALDAKATELGGLGSVQTAASSAMGGLGTYLGTITPGWTDSTADSAVSASAWQTGWGNAYTAVANLQAAIQGKPGLNAMSVTAAPSSIQVLCDFGGTPKGGESSKTVQLAVIVGSSDVTSSTTYAVTAESDCDASVSSAGVVTMTSFAQDSGYCFVSATRSGAATIYTKIPYQKTKDGTPGASVTTPLSVSSNANWTDSTAIVSLAVQAGGTLSGSARWRGATENNAREGGVRVLYRQQGTTAWNVLASGTNSKPSGEPGILAVSCSGSVANSLGATVYEMLGQTYRTGTFTAAITPSDMGVGWGG